MIRRALIVPIVFVVIIVAALVVGDVIARHEVQDVIASRIQKQVPGSHAKVNISSFPFTFRLAAWGNVPKLTADVTNVVEGKFAFESVDVVIHDLDLERDPLLDGRIDVRRVTTVTVQATMTQAALDQVAGTNIVLGQGSATIGNVTTPITVTVVGGSLEFGVTGANVAVKVPVLSLLPCVSTAAVEPGRLVLSCTTTTVPSAFTNLAGHV